MSGLRKNQTQLKWIINENQVTKKGGENTASFLEEER